MSKRSNSRKLAMRMLYQLDIRQLELATIFNDLEKDKYAEETVNWAFELASITNTNLDDIDGHIAKLSIDWESDRINHIDKALLRMGMAEINYIGTPYQVVINEILELSKEYSTEESAKFINGILDKFVKGDMFTGLIKDVGQISALPTLATVKRPLLNVQPNLAQTSPLAIASALMACAVPPYQKHPPALLFSF